MNNICKFRCEILRKLILEQNLIIEMRRGELSQLLHEINMVISHIEHHSEITPRNSEIINSRLKEIEEGIPRLQINKIEDKSCGQK